MLKMAWGNASGAFTLNTAPHKQGGQCVIFRQTVVPDIHVWRHRLAPIIVGGCTKGNRSRLLPFFPSPLMGEDKVGVDFAAYVFPTPTLSHKGGGRRERLHTGKK
jgi:hypothetical protein